MPTCTAAKNRFGLLVNLATRAPRLLLLDSCFTWESRSEIKAISAATKIPPTAIKPKTIAILGKTLSAISLMISIHLVISPLAAKPTLANSEKTPDTCHFESNDWLFTGHRFLKVFINCCKKFLSVKPRCIFANQERKILSHFSTLDSFNTYTL